jgi:hypothetical protein
MPTSGRDTKKFPFFYLTFELSFPLIVLGGFFINILLEINDLVH